MSQTYVGIIVSLLAVWLPNLGLEIGNDQLTTTVSVAVQIIGALLAFWGRYRLGGVTVAGLRVLKD